MMTDECWLASWFRCGLVLVLVSIVIAASVRRLGTGIAAFRFTGFGLRLHLVEREITFGGGVLAAAAAAIMRRRCNVLQSL